MKAKFILNFLSTFLPAWGLYSADEIEPNLYKDFLDANLITQANKILSIYDSIQLMQMLETGFYLLMCLLLLLNVCLQVFTNKRELKQLLKLLLKGLRKLKKIKPSEWTALFQIRKILQKLLKR